MIGALKSAWDRFRGSGEAAVTVPPMDGALRSNQLLEEAPLSVALEAPDDLAHDGRGILVSSRNTVRRLGDGGAAIVASFEADVTALAANENGAIAVALAEGGVVLIEPNGRRGTFNRLGDGPASCITAMVFETDGGLLVAQGSSKRSCDQWKRDLMERCSDGSVWRIDPASDKATRLAGGLSWPYGLATTPEGGVVVSESWRHRLVTLAEGKRPEPVLSDLPGYPARIHADPRGGYWLAVFAPRNQIIEFIQREPAFLARMIEEVDEAYWAAPSLKPSATFLEPLQGGAQKHLGMLKPWAPTRSYGLVVRLDAAFRPVSSLHSRADGTRHGVMSCLPSGGQVIAASKGGDAVIEIERQAAASIVAELKEAAWSH